MNCCSIVPRNETPGGSKEITIELGIADRRGLLDLVASKIAHFGINIKTLSADSGGAFVFGPMFLLRLRLEANSERFRRLRKWLTARQNEDNWDVEILRKVRN